MDLLAKLAESSLLFVMLMLFAVQVVAHEIGGWVGRRHAVRGGAELDSVGLIVGGLLGLLGFVLALTLSFSTTRFQERQASTVAEANAISTAWLRAQATPDSRGGEIARLLEAYGQERKAFVLAPRSGDVGGKLSERTKALQAEIWSHLSDLGHEHQDPLTVGLMTAVNEAFDASSQVRFSLDVRPPSHGVWLLLGLAVLTIGALGYRLGLKGPMFRMISALLIAAWTMVIVVILDLGAPRVGSILTSTAPYDWMLQGFESGSSPPPGSHPN